MRSHYRRQQRPANSSRHRRRRRRDMMWSAGGRGQILTEYVVHPACISIANCFSINHYRQVVFVDDRSKTRFYRLGKPSKDTNTTGGFCSKRFTRFAVQFSTANDSVQSVNITIQPESPMLPNRVKIKHQSYPSAR